MRSSPAMNMFVCSVLLYFEACSRDYLVARVASYPGVPILIWRRGEDEHLVHTVVHMHLISENSRKMGYPGNFPCNGHVRIGNFLQPQNHKNRRILSTAVV